MDVTEIVNNPRSRDGLSVEDNSLDVLDVIVVLQSTHEELLAFAHGGDLESVVLIPLSQIENGINDVRFVHDVPFENLSLPRTIFGSVLLHAVDEEGAHFLEFTSLAEDFSDLMDVGGGVGGNHGFSKLDSLLGVSVHRVADHGRVVHVQTVLSCELIGFIDSSHRTKGGHNLQLGVSLLVDFQGESLILRGNEVTKRFRGLELALVNEILNSTLLVLSEQKLS